MGFITNSFRFVVAVEATFASMYETFQALTSIQVSHFVEWFSGDDLDSIWNKNTGNGSPTYAMDDVIDGGFKITTGSAGNNRGGINFNNKRHYAHDGSIMIAVWKSGAGGENQHLVGFSSVIDIPLGLGDSALSIIENGFTVFRLQTSASATATRTSTDVSVDTNFHTHKVETTASDVDYFIDGVLKVTNTTNLPAIAMQPYIDVRNNLAVVNSVSITYFEAFNTSVTILSSLYERLSALTQVAGQRVVETFSGALLNERWTETDVAGTGTFAMSDNIDGGFSIISGATAENRHSINFNNKRQYDETDSVVVAVARAVESTLRNIHVGWSNTTNSFGADHAVIENSTVNTNYAINSQDVSTESVTEGSVPIDESYHSLKLVLSSTDMKSFIDGVLDVTKTTNRPTNRVQPIFEVRTKTSATREGRIMYLEAYNKLATETDFPSIYELFNALTSISKSHFWDWFDGDSLNNRWTVDVQSGSSSLFIDDVEDGGFKFDIASGTTAIHFNAKRHYDETASEIIFVFKCFQTTGQNIRAGMSFLNALFSVDAIALMQSLSSDSFFNLLTGTTGGNSATASSISQDTIFHVYKIENGSADIKLTIDGVLEVTKTTNRPDNRMQPNFGVNGTNIDGAIRYCEALNT